MVRKFFDGHTEKLKSQFLTNGKIYNLFPCRKVANISPFCGTVDRGDLGQFSTTFNHIQVMRFCSVSRHMFFFMCDTSQMKYKWVVTEKKKESQFYVKKNLSVPSHPTVGWIGTVNKISWFWTVTWVTVTWNSNYFFRKILN